MATFRIITLLALTLLLAACGGTAGPDAGGDGSGPLAEGVDARLYDEVEGNPNDPQARLRLATALRDAEHLELARAQFERLVEIDPSNTHLIDLARTYEMLSRGQLAEATYRRVVQTDPAQPVALYRLAEIARGRGELGTAIELYSRSVQADPKNIFGFHGLGQALEQVERYRDAYRAFEEVLLLEPNDPIELEIFDNALFRAAMLDLKMGATERAAEFLEVFLENRPNDAAGHYAYGQALSKLGRTEEAERAFETHRRLSGDATGDSGG